MLANFGMGGVCIWMLAFGVLTNVFFRKLIAVAPVHEPLTFCLIYSLPGLFLNQQSITGFLGALRLVPFLFILLMFFSVRHKRAK